MSADVSFDLALETAQRMLLHHSRTAALDHARYQLELQRGDLPGDDDRRAFWQRVCDYIEKLPSPSERRLNGFSQCRFQSFGGEASCRVCGKPMGAWDDMKLVGHQVMPPFDDDPGEVLELRNHTCGGTFAETLPFTAQALLDELDLHYGGKRDRATQAHAIEQLKQRANWRPK